MGRQFLPARPELAYKFQLLVTVSLLIMFLIEISHHTLERTYFQACMMCKQTGGAYSKLQYKITNDADVSVNSE